MPNLAVATSGACKLAPRQFTRKVGTSGIVCSYFLPAFLNLNWWWEWKSMRVAMQLKWCSIFLAIFEEFVLTLLRSLNFYISCSHFNKQKENCKKNLNIEYNEKSYITNITCFCYISSKTVYLFEQCIYIYIHTHTHTDIYIYTHTHTHTVQIEDIYSSKILFINILKECNRVKKSETVCTWYVSDVNVNASTKKIRNILLFDTIKRKYS